MSRRTRRWLPLVAALAVTAWTVTAAQAQPTHRFAAHDDTYPAAEQLLVNAGITPVAEALDVDLGGLLTQLDPAGGFFGHDKVEGVATTDRGRTLVVSNDSDFGIVGITNDNPPFQLDAKILPNGQQDDAEYLAIDTTKLPAVTYTATVTITVI